MLWLSVAAGLVLLTLGAEALIQGASALARKLGMSELLIGLTLVGFGTSSPELVSSVGAALAGSPGVAVGNVVGSNIANILLILGLSALIAPIAVGEKGFRRDAIVLAGATLAAIGVSLTGEFGRLAGALFLAALLAYLGWAYLSEKANGQAQAEAASAPHNSTFISILFAVAGLGLLGFGAHLLVTGAIGIAKVFHVSETLIGLTIVALGTSLPELVTSVMASLRGKSDLALGNIVGSNIYNLFGILGATALIHPVAAPADIVHFDNWVMLAATAVLILFAITRNRIERWEGAVLTTAYAGYIIYLAASA
ncbi:calcium/sodium antiporter [Hyphococcus sp.]|uniref:calcium/sodium antiporter n=1 Tax=Hyphococcus sp. TaxID=2038636 RepID=UPI0020858BC2|nr:MAG: sodium:calcium antiporter [Marinicaulis sp.]